MAQWIDFKLLKAQLSFAAVLQHYDIKATKDGPNHVKAKCPFHEDKKPSLGVDLERKIWQCFACKLSGNVLDFVTRMEGHDPSAPGAIRKGAEAAVKLMAVDVKAHSITKPKSEASKAGQAEPADVEVDDIDDAAASPEPGTDEAPNKPLSFQLKLEPRHAFLKAKGFNADTYAAFGIGYAKRGLMKGRICVPLHNGGGELIGYAGRTVSEDKPAWLYPPNFDASAHIFNWHRICNDLPDHLYLAGNYWDVLRYHEHGLASVAVPDFDLSDAHIEILAACGADHVSVICEGGAISNEASRCATMLAETVFVKLVSVDALAA